ncbi:MAG: protein-L-isoaspartate(D-aspartate) O-methyltransferase [Bacteroidota bacterium]|nr:protein-L-isoaspartate(D-aspartate) O-methyltransferase [Bacteroidota bacterium]MDP4226991.1 protein-L-isoaspartate(D-aspartate) O-methyltransferase [Bacteroidota bacterium]MDP4275019.1 protein-L-isoaspartate(D-aspartate) O-methyltransferase [Bacteroidota bacterium]
MRTKPKICFSCLMLVFLTTNCPNKHAPGGDKYLRLRKAMVEEQIRNRGIRNTGVLDAFMKVPRHKFVPEEYQSYSYDDRPLPIGYNQTISQPYIVAYMTEILNPDTSQKVLEIGTGSGYQAAILSLLYKEVYTVEIIKELAENAEKIFEEEGYNNIHVKVGDGYQGWKEYAPFDAIIVTCAPAHVPQPLVEQLAEGGRMIIPVGHNYSQELYLLEKKDGRIHYTETLPVLFVPMIREK